MSRRAIIRCILSLIIIGYMCIVLPLVSSSAANDTFAGVDIVVEDSANVGFVSVADIDAELNSISKRINNIKRCQLSTRDIELRLKALDKLEDANCVVLNNGMLRINVKPLRPVARIFDPEGEIPSYYINRDGKRMKADIRYRMDVPIITGRFDTIFTPQSLIPMLEYINAHQDINDLVTSIYTDEKHDIYIVPAIRGHVVNFGDTANIENKFDRLLTFYHKVLPIKGWEYYDTLSVKWRGQVVAKRRNYTPKVINIPLIDDGALEVDDLATMTDTQP